MDYVAVGCVDIANMDEEVLDETDRRVEKFIPAVRALLTEKTNSAVAFALRLCSAIFACSMVKEGKLMPGTLQKETVKRYTF